MSGTNFFDQFQYEDLAGFKMELGKDLDNILSLRLQSPTECYAFKPEFIRESMFILLDVLQHMIELKDNNQHMLVRFAKPYWLMMFDNGGWHLSFAMQQKGGCLRLLVSEDFYPDHFDDLEVWDFDAEKFDAYRTFERFPNEDEPMIMALEGDKLQFIRNMCDSITQIERRWRRHREYRYCCDGDMQPELRRLRKYLRMMGT